jgi:pimeloyl-ACP methyl ester carboxylesterase
MNTFTTPDGTQLYYKDWGTGRPIVFLHAWPLNADMWDRTLQHMANHGLRAIAYDRRGFGRSSQPWTGYDYDVLADDLHAFMNALSLDDVMLVGFSMGGGEVARYIGRHGGKRVTKAALISSVTPLIERRDDHPEGIDPAAFDGFRAALTADRATFMQGFGPIVSGSNRPGSPVTQAVLDWLQDMSMQASLKSTVACVTAFASTDFRADLAAFDLPTLIIHGGDDQAVPIDITGRAAAALVRDAQFKVYDGAPHALFLTDADRLNDDLLAFARS